jgi:predicted amidophosphoribosyltransferase
MTPNDALHSAVCDACGSQFRTTEPPPYCCDACTEIADEAEMADLEAMARAEGFASLDAWIEHQQKLAGLSATAKEPLT